MQPTPEQWAQIDAVMDRKIEAIRLYRLFTNADLVTAKTAIEARERGAAIPSAAEIRSLNWDDIDALLRSDQLIQAIKLYREQTGVGLKEAKDAVEARRAQQGMVSQVQTGSSRGCGVVAVLVVLLIIGVMILWFLR